MEIKKNIISKDIHFQNHSLNLIKNYIYSIFIPFLTSRKSL